ncbi:hypothetical protein [Curtobacterium ammoniigenes]|uniref:hypothetical protein n=1 Tax=Curtobacterium ammoniigenes TaxID=395387 RepID=UPI000833B839|nr:hypothetical protein [Curtobacterium ammoniigenes]
MSAVLTAPVVEWAAWHPEWRTEVIGCDAQLALQRSVAMGSGGPRRNDADERATVEIDLDEDYPLAAAITFVAAALIAGAAVDLGLPQGTDRMILRYANELSACLPQGTLTVRCADRLVVGGAGRCLWLSHGTASLLAPESTEGGMAPARAVSAVGATRPWGRRTGRGRRARHG